MQILSLTFRGNWFLSRNLYKDFIGIKFRGCLKNIFFPRPYFVVLRMISVNINTFFTYTNDRITHGLEDLIQKTLWQTETSIFAVHQFLKNYAGINFCGSQILKNFAEIDFRESTFWGSKKVENFFLQGIRKSTYMELNVHKKTSILGQMFMPKQTAQKCSKSSKNGKIGTLSLVSR